MPCTGGNYYTLIKNKRHNIISTQWRSRALLLKTVEGLVCAGPQLVLQMAFLMRGTLTSPVSRSDHHVDDSDGIIDNEAGTIGYSYKASLSVSIK